MSLWIAATSAAWAVAVLIFVFASFLTVVPLLVVVASILTTFLLVLGLAQLTTVSPGDMLIPLVSTRRRCARGGGDRESALLPHEILVEGRSDPDEVAARAPRRSGAPRRGRARANGGTTGPRSWKPPRSDSDSPEGEATLAAVRAAADAAGGGVYVGDQPAANDDFIDAVYGSFPLMIALITITTTRVRRFWRQRCSPDVPRMAFRRAGTGPQAQRFAGLFRARLPYRGDRI